MLTGNRVRTISRINRGRSLSLRRAWFSDAPNPGSGTPGAGNSGAGSGTPGTDDVPIETLPPKWQAEIKRLREENGDYRTAKNKFADEAAAKQKELDLAAQREQQRLVEEGKWKELAEKYGQEAATLKPYQERATALEAQIKAHNETRIARIPEVMRTVIPSEYTPEKLSQWLDANESKLTTPPAPDIDAGAGGGGKPPVKLTDEQLQQARRAGMTPEQFAKAFNVTSKGKP